MENDNIYLDPIIWGPHFWFVMHTIAIQYPNNPNETIKKKTYRFFTDLVDFLPNSSVRKSFSKMLDDYPVSPYLDTRLSLIKWVNFIHNKYNVSLGKEPIELYKGLEIYYEKYKNINYDLDKIKKQREKYLVYGLYTSLVLLGIYLYYNY